MIKRIKTESRFSKNRSNPLSRPYDALRMAMLILALTASAAQAMAQRQSEKATAPVAKADHGKPSTVLVSSEEDYRIGAGDVIEIQVEDMPEVSKSIRVTAAGTFLMPILGRMQARGKTTEALGQEIADRLRGDYLKDPQVNVVIREYNSRSFFIQGAVRNPGVFQIEGKPSLLTLITLAGGLADNHGSESFIIRKAKETSAAAIPDKSQGDTVPGSPPPAAIQGNQVDNDADEPKYELLKVNINNLFKGALENNGLLEPGDIVNIPPSAVFYVAGEVKSPGQFSLKEGTTLRQAVSLAQGINFNAATGKAIIFRDDARGKRQEIRVDIGAVMKGKKEDVAIAANDIIIIPNSRMKSVGGALIKAFGFSSMARVPLP